MLTEPCVVAYLRRHALIGPAQVVRDGLSVADVSRRHHDFLVTDGSGGGFLLKQGVGPERSAAVAREASVLSALDGEPVLAGAVPRLRRFDARDGILLAELIPDAVDLRAHHAARHAFPTLVARALGRTLATLHRLAPERVLAGGACGERPRPPWVLSIHRPTLELYRQSSRGNVRLIETVQGCSELCDSLDDLRSGWRPTALVHGDVKWDNVLAVPAPGATRRTRIRLIDWELAGAGDPCWDVGSVFSEYLACWLGSIPRLGDDTWSRSVELAACPLETMAPALEAFWSGYAERATLAAAKRPRWLVRAVRCCGARLIQTAFEQTQGAVELSAHAEAMLQLSANVLERPEEAAVRLLGLELDGAVS